MIKNQIFLLHIKTSQHLFLRFRMRCFFLQEKGTCHVSEKIVDYLYFSEFEFVILTIEPHYQLGKPQHSNYEITITGT